MLNMDTIMYPYTLVLGSLLDFLILMSIWNLTWTPWPGMRSECQQISNTFWLYEWLQEGSLPNMCFGADPKFKITTRTGKNFKMGQ